jgi:endo-1,4-beta-D-glucanase Y
MAAQQSQGALENGRGIIPFQLRTESPVLAVSGSPGEALERCTKPGKIIRSRFLPASTGDPLKTLVGELSMGLRTSLPRKRWLVIALMLTLCASGGCKESPWTPWNSYSARFIDAQGRVIDPQGGSRTTSEGQSYALFFALVDNDRPTFDRVLNWTQANLSNGDLGATLPAWLWGKSTDGQWKTLDPHSASDSDVWIAYSLVEAGRLWKYPAYSNLGRKMMAQIAKTEVEELPGFGTMLLPGAVGFKHGQTWILNPSYLPEFVFERFAAVDPGGPWRRIASGIPRLLEQSARHGFAMDWVEYVPGDGFYPTTQQRADDKSAAASTGSYDAIRVYLWAGLLDTKDKTRSEILSAVPGMSVYLADHSAPPEKVSDQGIPQPQDGPVGFSAALLPYLRAFPDLSKEGAQQTIRMSTQRDPNSGLYGKDVTYYDQNLALFATGFVDGRFRFGVSGELNVEWTR